MPMEAQEYVREYVRDQRTWRRAARQSGTERRGVTGENMNALWDVCRFGSSENAETAQFALALRARDVNAPLPVRKPWDPTPKARSVSQSKASPDILEIALQRNLKRAGLSSAFDKAASSQQRQKALLQSQRPSSCSPIHPHTTTRWLRYALDELVVDEEAARAKHLKTERRQRSRILELCRLNCANTLLDEEYNGRRLLFRAAIVEQKAILEAEQHMFGSLVGMSREQFLAQSGVVGLEAKRRQILCRMEERDRTTLSQLIQLLQLESLEREIASCARREAQLRGVLTGSTKPT